MRPFDQMGIRGRKAFTTLELIVVILIIVLAISILLPSISRMREGSGRVKCAANLKQIGLALQLYSNENKGSYPRTGYVPGIGPIFSSDAGDGSSLRDPFGAKGLPGKVGDNDITAAIFLLIRTQEITPEVFVCDYSDQEKDTFGKSKGASAMNKTSFSDWRKNLSYSFANPYPDTEAVKNKYVLDSTSTSEFAVVADMNPGIGDGFDATLPTENSPINDMKKANTRNHQGAGQDVLYGDGHVAFEQNPFCGRKRDNIYTVSGSTDGSVTTSKVIVGSPKWAGDGVLLPASK